MYLIKKDKLSTPRLRLTLPVPKCILRAGIKRTEKPYQLFTYSQLVSSVWQQPVRLNSTVNAEGYNSKHPFVSADGKRLFFSSDRPGGEGGDDIWESNLDDAGQPKTVSNLGDAVNSRLMMSNRRIMTRLIKCCFLARPVLPAWAALMFTAATAILATGRPRLTWVTRLIHLKTICITVLIQPMQINFT
jgi:hypothetical protein